MNPKISFYKNLQEQKNMEREYAYNLDPKQRLIQAMALIRKIYSKEFSTYIPSKRINFIKP